MLKSFQFSFLVKNQISKRVLSSCNITQNISKLGHLGLNSRHRYFHYTKGKNVINDTPPFNVIGPEQILRAPSSGINPEEDQYLDLIHDVLINGNETNDRTNTGVHSKFGAKLVYNLRTGFPLITSKKMFWKGVVTELLWLLRGNTNAKDLAAQGNNIWNKDTSREKLDERGMFHLQEGDCGATYGFNLRHFGANYKTCNDNYKGQGVDQLANCITTLKTNPTDRRIILNLWNPSTLNNCALPPCLLMYILYVANGELSCFTVQRSGDLLLGIPFNIASSSLLTHILANMTDLQVGDLHHNIVNAHIYNTHINGAKEQLLRRVHAKCQLQMPQIQVGENSFITRKLSLHDIDSGILSWKDFKLIDYQSEAPLNEKLVMAA
jgi:thymidylate synthase